MLEKIKKILRILLELIELLEKILNRDLNEQIEQEERFADDFEAAQPIENLVELQRLPERQQMIAIQWRDPGAKKLREPGAKKRSEERKENREVEKKRRALFWIGIILLFFSLSLVVVFSYVVSSSCSLPNPEHGLFLIGIALLVFVFAIALVLPDPPPRLPATVLRHVLAIATALSLWSAPGTINITIIPGTTKATGVIAIYVLTLFFTPRPPALWRR